MTKKQKNNVRLTAALDRIWEAEVTLNRDKCKFEKEKLLFLGHVIDVSFVICFFFNAVIDSSYVCLLIPSCARSPTFSTATRTGFVSSVGLNV